MFYEIDFIKVFIPKLANLADNIVINFVENKYQYLKQNGIMLCRNDFKSAYPDFNLNIYYIFNDDLKNFTELQLRYHWHIKGHIKGNIEKQISNLNNFFELYDKYDNEFFYKTNKEMINKYYEDNYIYYFDINKNKLNKELVNIKTFHTFSKNNKNFIKSIYDFFITNPDINIEVIGLFNKDLFRTHVSKRTMKDNEIKEIIYFYLEEIEKENRETILNKEDFYNKYDKFDLDIFKKFNKKYEKVEEIICITDYHSNNLIGSLNDFLEKHIDFNLEEFKETMLDKNLSIIDNLVKFHLDKNYRRELEGLYNEDILEEKIEEDNFDWEFYLDIYPDLEQNGIKTKEIAYNHWIKFGKKEGRKCNLNSIKKNIYIEKLENKYNFISNNKNKFNILIRTCHRPNYFKKCINSVLNQNYDNFRVIVSYDNKECLNYLEEYNIEKYFVHSDSNEKYKFNLYCNFLIDKVEDGWIIFLDDDDIFTDNNVLSLINENINSNEDFLIWKFLRPDKEIYPQNLYNIKLGEIDTTSFCFNSKYKYLSEWNDKQYGDYFFINNLLNKNKFNIKFINEILTKTIFDNKISNFGESNEILYFKSFISKNKIKQICISKSLEHLKERILRLFNLQEYNNNFDRTIFFGIYLEEDFSFIENHNGIKFIMLGGSDVPNIVRIKCNNIISISKDIKDRLNVIGLESILINFNLVDKNIFKPMENLGNRIYVYDGIKEKGDNSIIYNIQLINEIKKELPQFEYIHSSELNLKNNEMPPIYSKCFIGLRLTNHDGNANTVQEFESMEIPIIHNQSNYGLKWKNKVDIIDKIKKFSNNSLEIKNNIFEIFNYNILIVVDFILDLVAGDTNMVKNYINKFLLNENKISILTKHNPGETFLRDLTGEITFYNFKNIEKINFDDFKIIFSRTSLNIAEIIEEKLFYKTIVYGIDNFIDNIKTLNNKFMGLITQSQKLKDFFIKNGIEEKKILIQEPFSLKYDFKLPERNDNEIRLIYCGTLRDEENIIEIIEEFKKIHQERPEVTLKIVWGKIVGDSNFTIKINEYLKNGVKGITFKHKLSHKEACYEIATSDIGICWRKNGWGDNGEISTKVKEYEMYEQFIINNLSNITKKNKVIISDNFTYEQFNSDNSYFYLHYTNKKRLYETIIKFLKPKLLFVDSFWKGVDFTWNKINEEEKFKTVNFIVMLCDKYNIKKYFWNKEDPISFKIWVKYAKLFDVVFTTDVSCKNLYKTYGISAEVLPFLANPKTYKINKYNNLYNDKILFAGSWYAKYNHRCIMLDTILEKYKSNFVIFDRNYKGLVNNDKRYMYPYKFTNNIKPSINCSQLNIQYKEYKYILNLNSVTKSYSMCARRIFEILISGAYPISNYSNALDVIFSGYLYYLTDNCIVKKKYLKKFLCCILHTFENYLQTNIDDNFKINIIRYPSIAVIFYTDSDIKSLNINSFIQCYRNQNYINKQCYIISNGNIFKYDNINGILLKYDSVSEIYFTFFSNSLFYMKNYLKNFMIFQINNIDQENTIYTKLIDKKYLQDNNLWFLQVHKINIDCFMLKTEMFSNLVNFKKNLINKINEYVLNKKIITLDPYNVSLENYNDVYSTEIQQTNFTGYTINDLKKINTENNCIMNNNLTNELLSEIKINGNYNSYEHIYGPFIKKKFQKNGIIYFSGPNEIILYCLNTTTGEKYWINSYTKYNILKDHNYEFAIRFGPGKYNYSLRSLNYNENIIINRSLVIITNTYPSIDNIYRNGFIHTRNTLYQDYLSITLICLSNSYTFKQYVYENVVVYCMNSDFFKKVTFGNLQKFSIHFLNKYIYETIFLNKKFDNIKKNIFIHGSEIQPSHRRLFDEKYVKNGKLDQDMMKKKLWNNVTKHNNTKYIFVSNYFYNEVCEDYGKIFKNIDIIHNPIDYNNFNYIKKDISQRKKILILRSFDSTKYANDISIKCILELSKKTFFTDLEISVYGKGVLFDELTKLIKKFKNITINNKFLNHSEISKVHKNFGIFICPTRMDSQGCSMCEAMSSGLVPITTNITAIPEFVNNKCGFLCEPENYVEMADSIEKLYNDPNLFQKMSLNSSNRIRTQLNLENIIKKELA